MSQDYGVSGGGGKGLEGPWISEASYWIPDYVVESAWLEHAAFSAWLMGVLRPDSVVELGTHSGFSYFALCDFADRLGLSTRFVAIDTWQGDEHAGFYGEETFAAVVDWNRRYEGRSTLLRSRFDEARPRIQSHSVDLLHIDGRHRYEDVSEDFRLYLSTVSRRGVVLFHDIAEYSGDFGVHRFWAEIKQEYPTFEFAHGHGLGVALVGPDSSPLLSALAAADESTSEAVRSAYARLGRRAADIRHLLVRSAAADALELELAQAGALIQQLNDERAGAQAAHAGLAAEVSAFRASTSWRITAPVRWLGSAVRWHPSRKASE